MKKPKNFKEFKKRFERLYARSEKYREKVLGRWWTPKLKCGCLYGDTAEALGIVEDTWDGGEIPSGLSLATRYGIEIDIYDWENEKTKRGRRLLADKMLQFVEKNFERLIDEKRVR